MAGSKTAQSPAASNSANAKVFRDPIHNLIRLGPEDRWVLELIDTKEFQRLRRIRQLGLAHFVYPGAEHTRFTHSLGVFNFARRIIQQLLQRHASEKDLCRELKKQSKIIKAAALLHDVGHGPFSHVFERVFAEEETGLKKHDDWTCDILKDRSTEIHKVLAKVCRGRIVDICGLISDSGSTPANPYVKDIVSSQLDADRMDYLLRDSMMTGSRYGQYDSEWVLNALAIGNVKVARTSVKKKLCLDVSKGTGAVEGLLFARLLMRKYVYGHKTTGAYEAELVQTIRLAMALEPELPNDTPEPVRNVLKERGNVSIKDYLMLDDEVMWWALRRWAAWGSPPHGPDGLPEALKRHALRLVRRQKPWKSVRIDDKQNILKAKRLTRKLSKQNNPLRFECYLDDLANLPYKDYDYLRGQKSDDEEAYFKEIFLLGRDGKATRLSKEPDPVIIRSLSEKSQGFRFHFDRQFSKEFSRLLPKLGICLV